MGVLRAGRSWVYPEGEDLAVLVLENAPPDLRVTTSEELGFEEPESSADTLYQSSGEDGAVPGDLTSLSLDERRGAVAVRGGVVVGIVGEREGNPAIVPLSRLPEALRPKQ